MDPAVKNRIAIFAERPTEEQLGAELGYGLMGGSNRRVEDGDHFFKIAPQPIPIVGVTIWMYFVLAFAAILPIWLGPQGKEYYVLLIFSGIVIIPVMMAMLSWINGMMGTEPYIVFDKQAKQVELPRLSMTFPQEQIREIVFLDRFVENNEHWQIAMVVEEKSDRWLYVHLYNIAGREAEWFGHKNDYNQLALSLGIGSRGLRFSRKESKLLNS